MAERRRPGRPELERIQVTDPAAQSFIDMASRAIRDLLQLDKHPFGIPTNILKKDGKGVLGDLVRCDPTEAAFTIIIPEAKKADVGKMVCIANVSASTNTITVQPAGGDTIGGASNATITTAYGVGLYVIADEGLWEAISGGGASGGGSGTLDRCLVFSDDTQLAETSSSYVTKKTFSIVNDSDKPVSGWRLIVEAWYSGGTSADVQLSVGSGSPGSDSVNITATASGTVFTVDLSATDGDQSEDTVMTADINVKANGGGTAYIKYTDLYAIYT